MREGILISFILPIYNVEEYLEECFNSIENQADTRCEIILVDDGATDSSGKIADQLKEKTTAVTVKVIHKKNGGLASARNAGLEVAKGKFISFIDSDDRLEKNCLPSILEYLEFNDFDLCFMQGVKFFPDGKKVDLGDGIGSQDINGKEKIEILKFLSTRNKFCGSSCTKSYKRAYLESNILKFPDDERVSEDLGFVRDAILNSEKLVSLDTPFYEYRQGRIDSITTGNLKKRFFGLRLFLDESLNLLTENKKAKDETSFYFLNYIAYEYTIMMFFTAQMPKRDQKECCKILKEYKWVFSFAKAKRTRIIGLISKIFGIKITSKIICLIKTRK